MEDKKILCLDGKLRTIEEYSKWIDELAYKKKKRIRLNKLEEYALQNDSIYREWFKDGINAVFSDRDIIEDGDFENAIDELDNLYNLK